MGMPDPGQARENVVERPRHFGRQFRQFRQFQQFSAGCFLLKVMIRSWCLFLNNRIISDNINKRTIFFIYANNTVIDASTFFRSPHVFMWNCASACFSCSNIDRYTMKWLLDTPFWTDSFEETMQLQQLETNVATSGRLRHLYHFQPNLMFIPDLHFCDSKKWCWSWRLEH